MNPGSRRLWLWFAVAALLLSTLAVCVPSSRSFILRSAGRLLVSDQPPVKSADVIVVATDADGAGTLEASDLVHDGVSTRVAVFADPPSPVDREFIRRGLPYDDRAAISVQQLQDLGVVKIERIPSDVSKAGGLGRSKRDIGALLMMNLSLSGSSGKPLVVLCLGCHSDDIEIGCGGTILRLIDEHPSCRFYWAVFSAIGTRKAEAQRAAELFVGCERLEHLLLKDFRDGFMPFVGSDVKEAFEEMKNMVSPDIVFTHNRKDAHQDHRLLSELTWNTFRNHLILEYEIPKYDGDLGQPNVFVPLDTEIYQKKIRYLMDVFATQRSKHWFKEETFLALMRLRGMECAAPSGYAEGFYARKLVI